MRSGGVECDRSDNKKHEQLNQMLEDSPNTFYRCPSDAMSEGRELKASLESSRSSRERASSASRQRNDSLIKQAGDLLRNLSRRNRRGLFTKPSSVGLRGREKLPECVGEQEVSESIDMLEFER